MTTDPQDSAEPQSNESSEWLPGLAKLLLIALLGGLAAFAAFQIFGGRESGEAMVRVPGGSVPLRGLVAALACAAAGLPVGAICFGVVFAEPDRGLGVGAVAGFLGGGIGASCSELMPAVILGAIGVVLFCLARGR